MLRSHLQRMQQSLGSENLAPDQHDMATETGNQQLRHVTNIWDQSLRALRRRHGQVVMVPVQVPHITTENSAGQG